VNCGPLAGGSGNAHALAWYFLPRGPGPDGESGEELPQGGAFTPSPLAMGSKKNRGLQEKSSPSSGLSLAVSDLIW
jgi:hypothetical protein